MNDVLTAEKLIEACKKIREYDKRQHLLDVCHYAQANLITTYDDLESYYYLKELKNTLGDLYKVYLNE